MKFAVLTAAVATVVWASPVLACSTQNETNQGPCVADGSACDVMCSTGQRAGVMYWNGSVWTDGVRSNEDFETEALAICEASGTSC